MKNFKLLLATTAFLSIGLMMNVSADEPATATMNVRVGILVPDVVAPIQDIDFGNFILNASELSSTFRAVMDPETGSIDTQGYLHSGSEQNGRVVLTTLTSSSKTINITNSVLLNDYEGHELRFEPSFAQIGDAEYRNQYKTVTYGIGGSLLRGSSNFGDGVYTGEITVTVVEDTGE